MDVTGSSAVSVRVGDLTENSIYAFTVVAVGEHGPSVPDLVIAVHLPGAGQ